jgi:hypothetical protein
MCQQVYLAAAALLPLVAQNSVSPAFYVEEADPADRQMLGDVFEGKYFYYSVGSFMGCSCGLFCDNGFQESEPETYAQRLVDSLAFKCYLLARVRQQEIWLFTTDWNIFPDSYPQAHLSLSAFDNATFDLAELPENVILTITA